MRTESCADCDRRLGCFKSGRGADTSETCGGFATAIHGTRTMVNRVMGIVRDQLFRQKSFTIDFPCKLSVATKDLKLLVRSWTKADSALAKKRIDGEFMQLEVELRVLSSPDAESMAVTYVTMFPQHSREHYRSIVRIKGVGTMKKQERYLEEYDRQVNCLILK